MSGDDAGTMPPPPPPAGAGPVESDPYAGEEVFQSMASLVSDVGADEEKESMTDGGDAAVPAPAGDGTGDDDHDLPLADAVNDLAEALSHSGSSVRGGAPATPLADENGDEDVTFGDIFGSDFYENDFAARRMTDGEIYEIKKELDRKVQRLEDNEFYDKMWEDVFGNEPETREFLKKMADAERAAADEQAKRQELLEGAEGASADDIAASRGALYQTGDVHNVSTFSAPDGKRYNPYAGRNRYFPKSNIYLTSMPTLDNYQCLHLPIAGELDNRRIKVTGPADVLQDRKPIQAGLQGAGQTYPGAIFTPHNVIRWRRRRGGIQGNARMMQYDNGDTVLRVGNDYFIVESRDCAQENQHLMGAHGGVLLQYAKIRKMWRLRALTKAHGKENSTVKERLRKKQEGTLPAHRTQKVERHVQLETDDAKDDVIEKDGVIELDGPAPSQESALPYLSRGSLALHDQSQASINAPLSDDDADSVGKRAMDAKALGDEPVVKRRRMG